jgi:predicted dithiol-disulfide oxidoreductase (DUF899 family)
MQLPPIVGHEEWQAAHEALLTKEKAATRARDALAAERRRQPMTEFSTDDAFEGPEGVVTLLDLFQGRRQLIVYHFWFPPGGPPCGGCTMFTDQVSELAHLNARDTSWAHVSRAPQPQIEAFKRRMGWSVPWYTVVGEDFQEACGPPSTSPSTSSCATATAPSSPTRPPAAGSRRSAACGPSST